MLRKIIHIIVWLGVFTYLGISLAFTEKMEKTQTVESIDVNIVDSLELQVVSEETVYNKLKLFNKTLRGLPVDSIDMLAVGDIVRDIHGVKDAAVYYTPDGNLKIRVWQQHPVVRILSDKDDYFLHEDNEVIKTPISQTPRVLILTGTVDLDLAKGELLDLVNAIKEDSFYSYLIQGIHVNRKGFLEIIPRVGNHRIYFGEVKDFEWKLIKLKAFYNKALPNFGWDRYSSIDLRYGDQVVCKKK